MKDITEIIILLKDLIKTPSFSRAENKSADLIQQFLKLKAYSINRKGNNLWVYGKNNKIDLPFILLNSHHDTVKPVESWTIDPFEPVEEKGKIFGLGSNDAGASLVSLLATFFYLDEIQKNYNIVFAATAEEEISGAEGMHSIIDDLEKINLAVIGEPTIMQMAVAEKGLLVLDCTAEGKAGHAARDEGDNAIYKAQKDIEWIRKYNFPKKSELLGQVKMTVTQINAGIQHNIIPDNCNFVVDVRSNEKYSNKEIFEIIDKNTLSKVTPRSFRLNSSSIDLNHPIVKKGVEMGLTYFGSPTTSDQATIPWKSIKIGPGDSARSHSANEYIYISEIEKAISIYIELLKDLELS
ncbi:M20 family metallo-hydrolase [Bacteroidota bacterium]